MIEYIPYSMFDAFDNPNIQTVVNTINCMGIMGKGLAQEFKIRYPKMFEDYIKRWKEGLLNVGEPYLYKADKKWIFNFPTKNHWRYPSKLEFIESGLKYFKDNYKKWGVKSIAFPRLGCTSGGLSWDQVKTVMEKYLLNLKDIDIYIYLDQQTSEKEKKILCIFNSLDKNKILQIFKLSNKQVNSIKGYIEKRGNLKRFRDLLEIKEIGPVAYQKVLINRRVALGVSQSEFQF